jgi:hypothetical protein
MDRKIRPIADMTTVVISQPLLFPWPGFFELFATADIYVHLDDVQFADKSFTNRIQLKLPTGPTWMTIPVRDRSARNLICNIEASDEPWRRKHRELIRHSLAKAPHLDGALSIFDASYARQKLVDLLIESVELPAKYLGIFSSRQVLKSSSLGIKTVGSQRILDIVRHVGGTRYVTAHGAANYLDHELFSSTKIAVEYIDYSLTPYPQLHGAFTPYVSVLDLVANLGQASGTVIRPRTISWTDFLARRNA